MWTVEAAHRAGAAIRAFPSNILGVGKSISQTIPKIGLWISSMGNAATVNAMASGKSLWSGIASGIAGVGRSFISALPAVGAWIASGWATAVAWLAATWPILAVIAAVAVLAGGVYLLIKHWDAVSAFFVNLWGKVTGAFSAAFDWIRNKLAGVSDWVLAAAAGFLPFIGIPALIIKHWDTIAAFFVGLWTRITGWLVSVWGEIKTFFASLWNSIVSTFVDIWNAVPGFFASLWNGITGVVTGVANWFTGVWQTVTGAFASAWTGASHLFTSIWSGITGVVTGVANWFSETFSFIANAFAGPWTWVSNLFTSIWEGMKGVVMGFVEWLSPVVDLIIAPFRDIGNAIGGIIGSVKGWFAETVEIGETELAKMNENKMRDAAAKPVQTNTPAPAAQSAVPTPYSAASAAPILTATSAVTPGVIETPAQNIAPQAVTTTALSSGGSLAMEHIEAARRKGVAASDISYTASSAFDAAGAYTTPAPGADWPKAAAGNRAASSLFLESFPVTTATPSVDVPDIDSEARVRFAEAMPSRREAVIARAEREDRADETPRQNIFHIANMNFNADELRTLFDFVRQLEMAVMEPEAVTV
jgi:phage-related protein